MRRNRCNVCGKVQSECNCEKEIQSRESTSTGFFDFDSRLTKEFGRYGGIFMSFFVQTLINGNSKGIICSIKYLEEKVFLYWNDKSIIYTLENLERWEIITIQPEGNELLKIKLTSDYFIRDGHLEKFNNRACLSCNKSVFRCVCHSNE